MTVTKVMTNQTIRDCMGIQPSFARKYAHSLGSYALATSRVIRIFSLPQHVHSTRHTRAGRTSCMTWSSSTVGSPPRGVNDVNSFVWSAAAGRVNPRWFATKIQGQGQGFQCFVGRRWNHDPIIIVSTTWTRV